MAKAFLRGGGKAQSMVGVSAFLDEDFLLTTATARRLYPRLCGISDHA
jgi:hypothetical protein